MNDKTNTLKSAIYGLAVGDALASRMNLNPGAHLNAQI